MSKGEKMSKKEDKKREESVTRGVDLLLSLNLEPKNVAAFEFAIDTFRSAAAAKSWAKNHGFAPCEQVRQLRDCIVLRVRQESDFEDGTLQRSKLTRDVEVFAGVPNFKEPNIETEVPDPDEEAPSEVEFAKRGELIIRKALEGDPEKSVRMFGIVMKAEIPDCEGDVTSDAEIENANFVFMKDFGTIGFMHKKDVSDRVCLIQNVIAPVDFEFPLPDDGAKKIAKGTWYQELFSDDPEIVERVKVKKTLNGLSIGGKARREEITEMKDGEIRLLPDLPFSEQQKQALTEYVSKRAENVTKGEGDPALARFHDLRVEEVSLVDAAANEEDFFIVKRRPEMSATEKNQPAADPKAGAVPEVTPQKSEPSTTPEVTPEQTPEVTPSIAEQVAEGVTAGIKAAVDSGALTPAEKGTPESTEPETTPDAGGDSDVSKGIADLGKQLNGINERLDAQEETLKSVANVKATAKGQVPDGTTSPTEQEDKKPVNKWAGSAVHSVFGGKK